MTGLLGAALGMPVVPVLPVKQGSKAGFEVQSDTASASTIQSSQGGVALQAGGTVNLQGAQVDAAENITISGTDVNIRAAVNDTSVTGTSSTKTRGITAGQFVWHDPSTGINARKTTTTVVKDSTLARTTLNGANVSITASDTLAMAGTTVNTPGTLALKADTLFLGTQTTEHSTQDTSFGRDLGYQKAKDKGQSDQKTSYNQFNAGNLTVAANQIHAGLGAKDSLKALAQQPGMGWVQQLNNDPTLQGKIDWAKVEEAHKNWSHEQQGLTPEGAAIVTLVVAYFTAGAASGIGAAAGESAAVAAGQGIVVEGATFAAGSTVGAVVGGAVTAGISALAAQAAVALINNQGDIAGALHDLGSSASVHNLLTAIVTGGVLGGLNLNPTGLPTASGGTQPFMAQLQQNLTAGAARAVIGTAINGGDFETALRDALKGAILDTVAAQTANAVGDLTVSGQLDTFTNAVAHAIAGCAVGAARADSSAGCGAGALGAAIGELAATAYGGHTDTVQFAAMISGLAVAIAGGDARQINLGSQAGGNAAANNYLNHTEAALRERLKDKQRSAQTLTSAEHTQLDGLEILDIARDLALRDACSAQGNACDTARRGLNAALATYSSGASAMTDASLSAAANGAIAAQRDQSVALGNDPLLAAQSLLDSFLEFAVPQGTGYLIGGALGAYVREARAIYTAIQVEGEATSLVQQAANARAMLPQISQLRGNMGVANIDVPGVQPKMSAFSGLKSPTEAQLTAGFVGEVPEAFASSIVPTNSAKPFLLDRAADSEAKILNNVALQLGENSSASGVINSFTERAPCLSCSQVISKFQTNYPNIKINVCNNSGKLVPIR